MKVIERSVQEIGESLLVTLPKSWATAIGIKKGSKLKLLISEGGNLSIAPEFTQSKEKREATIPLDDNLPRRFYREYLYGAEKISIKPLKELGEKDRLELHSFLRKFMNVQVIEEIDSKIVVKCFKIDELSMEECLRRMYFLSKNILDESKDGQDKVKIKESRDTMTRFYYMLVMQVRRFLSEGKFSDSNQIPIIKAMDIRMVAEKIQRIGELSEGLSDPGNLRSKEILTKIKDHYSRSFNSFIENNFEKSVTLWKEGASLQKDCDKLKYDPIRSKKGPLLEDAIRIGQIARYSKEISMLVR